MKSTQQNQMPSLADFVKVSSLITGPHAYIMRKLRVLEYTILSLALAPSCFCAANVYNFENLSLANLPGQDAWSTTAGFPSQDYSPAFIYEQPSGEQGITVGSEDFWSLMRVNNSSFSFPSWSGNETSAAVQFDFRWNRADDGNGFTVVYGHDANGSGSLGNGERFGARYQNGNFRLEAFNTSGPGGSRTGADLGDVGDWFRVRAYVDLSGTSIFKDVFLEVKNLSRGDAVFTSLVDGGVADERDLTTPISTFDTISINLNKGSELDNLVIANDVSDLPEIPFTQVPEPACFALIAGMLGALSVLRRRGRESAILNKYIQSK